ncbi:ATP-binding protein [Streptantibioticus ferralitis]|uniref:ATP-binding protein n=1 Tax=Streptantibioticus ferralitis TaxID=236510 RepID=A0ABT5Z6P3_9ACTN|nr:ATP-binding protein [Streptantibioticus ferralitis]MDF2259507.1 ATP-binding protein [Streptantibioticus ferralitis]
MNREITHPGAAEAPPARTFSVQLSATRKGARLARLVATEQLRCWGLPLEGAALVVAELAANAALHARVPGRDFRLTLTATAETLRIEVIDARPERLPAPHHSPGPEEESGRGLLLVAAFATRWGVIPGPAPCKTIWAELPLTF